MEVVKGPDGGRDQALCQLVERHQTALLRMCYLYLHDQALAEDAVQETFLKAYKAIHTFRGECREKTWLMRIAINTCRDMRRSGWFRYVDRHVTPELLPEASAGFTEKDEEVTLAIMRLPGRCRETVMLRFYEQMSVAEIAQALNVTTATVSSQLHRAKKKLRSALERGSMDE